MFGSGQWTIWEGYAANKLMKAGFRSEQHRSERAPLHGLGGRWASCAPSAWTSRWAAMTTSRPPTRSCCGARTWRRCTRSCGRASPTGGCPRRTIKVAVLVDLRAPLLRPRRHPDHLHAADRSRDPELHRELHHQDRQGQPATSSRKHVSFKRGNDDIGYGLRPDHPLEVRPPRTRRRPRRRHADRRSTSSRASSNDYDAADTVASSRGVERGLAASSSPSCTPIPKIKVMSLWTMGFNQHTRGIWANNMVYNLAPADREDLHAGQQPVLARRASPRPAAPRARSAPSRTACRPTCVVDQPEAPQDRPKRSGSVPAGTIPDKPGYPRRACRTACCKDGKLNAYWVQVNNNMQAAANLDGGGASRAIAIRTTSSSSPTRIPTVTGAWRPT